MIVIDTYLLITNARFPEMPSPGSIFFEKITPKLGENGNFRPNYFEPKLAEMKMLLAIRIILKTFLDLLLTFCP